MATVLEAWDAKAEDQLSVAKGTAVQVLELNGQWAWCKQESSMGWVPKACLKEGGMGDGAAAPRSQGSSGASKQDQGVDHSTLALPEVWTTRLQNTMTLHTVSNATRLAAYLLQLLTSGYGTVSPLHITCWEGSLDGLEAVTEGSAGLLKDWHSRQGDLTPLHIAALCGHGSVVEYLLHQEVDPNVATVHGLSALHIAASSNIEVSEILVAGRADCCAVTADNDTPLHFACCYQRLPVMELLLQQEGVNASAANSFGVTALHITIAYAALENLSAEEAQGVLLLCSHGANPLRPDRHGRSPADVARAAGGDASLVDLMRAAERGGVAGVKEAASTLLTASRPRKEEPPSGEIFAGPAGQAKTRPSLTSRSSTAAVGRERSEAAPAADPALAEENAALASQVAHLSKELDESRSSVKHLEELLEHNKGLVQQMKSMADSAATAHTKTQAENNEALQQIKADLEKELTELRQQQLAMGEERGQWRCEKEMLQQDLAAVSAQRDHALAAARSVEAAAAQQKEAELQEKLTALGQKEAELLEQQRAEQEARAALGEKDAVLDLKDGEVKALAQQVDALSAQVEHSAAQLEGAQAAAQAAALRAAGEIKALQDGNRQLDLELQKQRSEREAANHSLSELRAQHTQLREAHAATQMAGQQAEADFREREAALVGQVGEQSLRIGKLEADAAEMVRRLQESEGWRERAEYANRMLRPLEKKIEDLRSSFNAEQALRKRFHNQMQDLKGAIRVYARIRPMNKRELGENVVAVRKIDTDMLELEDKHRKTEAKPFTFDSVFDEHSTQEDVFKECKSLVSSAFDGYNVTVFAYGQTGAGKTHTMYGNESQPGLVPRIADELFSTITRYQHECQASVRCCMFELYRDDLVDLYLPKGKGKPPPLDIKKDARGTVYVENASDRAVESPAELLKAIQDGLERRHVAATKMNADSSRSHLIFLVIIETTSKASKQVCTGKLTLCDLAGSERLKKSEATGEQMKEAQSINKSLSALGDVIEALTKHAKHVPYRNHKLTQLLSDSLGGNAKTLMFVNCSPAMVNADETGAALGYAARAKMITNKVEKNQDSQEVARLKKVIQVMGQELQQARGQGPGGGPPPPT